MSQDAIRRYVALVAEKRGYQDRLREIEQELTRLQPAILEWFVDEGIENQRVRVGEDSFNVFSVPVVRARARAGAMSELCAALLACGEDGLVKENVNANTLTAWVRERLDDGGIPKGVEPHLEIAQYREVRVNHVAASHK